MACDSLIRLAWQAARRMNFHQPMYTGQGPDDGRKEAVAVIVEMFGNVFSENERLRAIEQAAQLVRSESKSQTPCPDYGLRVTYRKKLNDLLEAHEAAAEGGKSNEPARP